MVTKADCVNARYREEFHHVTRKNADGTPMRVRVSGACKTWKTRPGDFQLPVKHGLYDSGYITQDNAHEWVKGDGRHSNPLAKKTVRRRGVTANAYINRPSQITRKSPTKRLKRRRAEAVKHPVKGRFPNPKQRTGQYDVRAFLEDLKAGPYAWPGGYPRYFVMDDGEAISFKTAKTEKRRIASSIRNKQNDGWRVVGSDINWEDDDLHDAHTGERIESAYGENPIRRKGVSASTYVRRPSQATKRAPTKRLQERRKRALKAPAGYFPNPRGIAVYFTQAGMAIGKPVAVFTERAKAEAYGRALARSTGRTVGIKG